jgi:hypothetical protein
MITKEYYEEKAWEILNTPYGTFAEKPTIRFINKDDYGVHFLINTIPYTFLGQSFNDY